MSEVARFYQYNSPLSGRRAVSTDDLMAKPEIARATLRRDIARAIDQLRSPTRFDRGCGGYVVKQGRTDSELLVLGFSQQEILSLVTLRHLVCQLVPGLLCLKIKPLQERLRRLRGPKP